MGFCQADPQESGLLPAEAILIFLFLKHTRPFPASLFSLPFPRPSGRLAGPYPSHLSSNVIFSEKPPVITLPTPQTHGGTIQSLYVVGGIMTLPEGDFFKYYLKGGTWLSQSVKHATLDVGVVGLSPILGVEII